MSEMSKEARSKARDKARRLVTTDPHQRLDASDWRPAEPLNTEWPTGELPVSPRAYKRGGKVEGASEKRADRKPRKGGGRALTPNNLINRDVKEANEERDGVKHVGGYKRGGSPQGDQHGPKAFHVKDNNTSPRKIVSSHADIQSARTARDSGPYDSSRSIWDESGKNHLKRGGEASFGTMVEKTARKELDRRERGYKKGGHVDAKEDKALVKSMVEKSALKPKKGFGGALGLVGEALANQYDSTDKKEKNSGGSVSDGTLQGTRPTGGRLARKSGGKAVNVNIVIAGKPSNDSTDQGLQVPIRPPPMPVAPPPMAGPPMVPPGPGGPPMPMPMARKTGGRALMEEAGAGSGLGRLQKIKDYGKNA